MGVWELILRITISFIVLFCLARIMGRKEISQMTFFNFISAIAIGTIAGSLAVNQNLSIRNGVIALAGWATFTLIMGVLDIKSKTIRKVTNGNPWIVIKDGQVALDALRKTRLDIDTLRVMLRQQHNVFQIEDVDYAIFETNGKLSVMKKDVQQPLTKGSMNNMPTAPHAYPMATEVISDGTVNSKNLSKLHLDENWLDQQLKQAGVNSPADVFYAEVQQDGTLHVDKGNAIH
ncbi:YetF domain-containing protein [Halobacillus naozhouensis]|uniref:DUF421 domain-containing protein n=1 Tax=Halobacillus naozhouensis TaxID=554880 RepID=A0ABY8IVU7_9BACI|nr:DUF421 domain-containing protein [Halobacillus naozhouensis]WFT74324.1 DUF421 domain-containing protein [Halobacillus naozhouensis]